MTTLYNVVSADWYIADKNGNENFIPDELWPKTLEIMRAFGALVMGRGTYEALQKYPALLRDPFEKLPIRKIVVSRQSEYVLGEGYELVTSPEKVISADQNVLISSGEKLNNYLFSKHLVDAVLLHQLPVALHEGISVFDSEFRELLQLQSKTDLGIALELKFIVRK